MPKYYIRYTESTDNDRVYIISAESPLSACIKILKNNLMKNILITKYGDILGHFEVNEGGMHEVRECNTTWHIPAKEVVYLCLKDMNG